MKKIFNEFLIGLLFTLVFIFVFTHKVEATIPVTIIANPNPVTYGNTSSVTWSSIGATSCSLFNDNTELIVASGTSGTYQTPVLLETTSFTLSCTSTSPSCDYYPLTTIACFVADTVVSMANGSAKNIQDVKVGDILKGEKTNNKVLGLHQPGLSGKLYSLNGGRYFVTEEHPFKTTDGWKSINPEKTREENLGIIVTELKVGDTLITDNGKILLKTIKSKVGKANTDLFNFILDGDHTYYADGYLVHNKIACDMNMTGACPSGEICISGITGNTINTANPVGSCAACPRTCNAGFTAYCNGDVTTCLESTGCPAVLGCQGTVAGSQYYDTLGALHQPGPYEGQPCSQFTTIGTCQQGNVTHGCTWAGAPYGYSPPVID